jgi:hypothetical protein
MEVGLVEMMVIEMNFREVRFDAVFHTQKSLSSS